MIHHQALLACKESCMHAHSIVRMSWLTTTLNQPTRLLSSYWRTGKMSEYLPCTVPTCLRYVCRLIRRSRYICTLYVESGLGLCFYFGVPRPPGTAVLCTMYIALSLWPSDEGDDTDEVNVSFVGNPPRLVRVYSVRGQESSLRPFFRQGDLQPSCDTTSHIKKSSVPIELRA